MASELPPSTHERLTKFISLIQYYRWSSTLESVAAPFVHAAISGQQVFGVELHRGTALLRYWLASLFVVNEGWKELGLADGKIGSLLEEPHLDVLRRYRNGVFHFQADFADARFADLEYSQATIQWALLLADAFRTYFAPHIPDVNVRLIGQWVFTGRA